MSLPEGWREIPLEKVVDILDSKRKPINNKERANRTLGKKESELYPYYGATGNTGFIDDFLFDEELVLLGEDGVPFYDPKKHKAYIINGKTWVNNHAHVLRAKEGITINSYLNYFLNAFDYHGYVNGATRLKLNQSNMKRIPIILPPLKEQKQIAQKLDQALARVERIKMALDNTPATIKRFRQSVLAVSGGLSEGKDFDKLPLNKLGSICGGKTPSKSKPEYWTDGTVWWVSAKDMKRFEIDSSLDKITEKAVSEAKMRLIPKNSILMVTRSGILSHTFPVAITKDVITINQDLKAFFVDDKIVDSKFLAYILRGEGQNILTQCSKDGTTVPSVSTEKLMNYEFSIPSLKEQQKIVNKIETLFTLADNLEAKVNQAQKRVDRLTQSILAKAFRGELL